MKAKQVISELCETLEATALWIKYADPTAIPRHAWRSSHFPLFNGKPVKSATMLRRIEKALKVAYRECGYADMVKFNKNCEEA